MLKESLVFTLSLFLVSPLFAGSFAAEKQADQTAKTVSLGSSGKGESPLVRAAAANRNKKRTAKIVITQETVRSSTGVLTTTTNTYIPPAYEATPGAAPLSRSEQQRLAQLETEKKEQQQREVKKRELDSEYQRAAADFYDESEDPAAHDPDLLEKRLHEIPMEAKSLEDPPS